ncbi:MAG TPA: hypothetical protein DCG69_04380 [Bacteroidales bacterium]|nr:hypothetical protein [Bacteroidales bacterium]
MPRNSTLENFLNNKLKTEQGFSNLEPNKQIIQNLLAYSKALEVFKNPSGNNERRELFQLIMN